VYDVAVNHAPQVAVTAYDAELRTISFSYSDQDADFPMVAQVEDANGTIALAGTILPFTGSGTFTATLPLGMSGAMTWRFSDNGINIVSGVYNPSSTEDAVLLPSTISCQMSNPFIPNTNIALKGLSNSPLKVSVFNLRGQNLGDIYAGVPKSTELSFNWDGKLSSGIYFLRIEQGMRSKNHRFVITK